MKENFISKGFRLFCLIFLSFTLTSLIASLASCNFLPEEEPDPPETFFEYLTLDQQNLSRDIRNGLVDKETEMKGDVSAAEGDDIQIPDEFYSHQDSFKSYLSLVKSKFYKITRVRRNAINSKNLNAEEEAQKSSEDQLSEEQKGALANMRLLHQELQGAETKALEQVEKMETILRTAGVRPRGISSASPCLYGGPSC